MVGGGGGVLYAISSPVEAKSVKPKGMEICLLVK